jgi:hypothetical protein
MQKRNLAKKITVIQDTEWMRKQKGRYSNRSQISLGKGLRPPYRQGIKNSAELTIYEAQVKQKNVK